MKTKKNKNSFHFTKKNKKKTFYVKTESEQLSDFVSKILLNNGFVFSNKLPVDFLFVSSIYQSQTNKINAFHTKWISNIYGKSFSMLTNKYLLYKYFGEQPFFVPTIFISNNNELPKLPRTFVKILKPEKEGAGKGITIVKNKKQIIDWLYKHNNYENWVLQDYIKHPDLFDKKKFHFRNYVILILKENQPIELYLSKKAYIVTAIKNYKYSSFDDSNIHNTHSHGRTEFSFFPDSLPDKWNKDDSLKIYNDMKNCVKVLFENQKDFKPEWGASNAFYIFGLDFMFENKKTYLLEINRRTGLRPNFLLEDVFNLLFNKPQSTYERIF